MRTAVLPPRLRVAVLLACLAPLSALAQQDLTLTEALDRATRQHPALREAQFELLARQGAQTQAAAGPAPQLSWQREARRGPLPGSDTLQWTQTLEWPAKREARLRAAQASTEQARRLAQARAAALRAQVQGDFHRLVAAQQQLDLAVEAEALATQATEAVSLRMQAGRIAPMELDRARMAEASARAERQQALGQTTLARQLLAQHWGGAGTEPFSALPPPLPTLTPPPPDSPTPPAVQWAQLELQRLQNLAELEQAARRPEPTLSLGRKREAESGPSQWVMGLSLPLPGWDSRQGALQEALNRSAQAREALQLAQRQAAAELAQQSHSLQAAHRQWQTLDSELLPAAQAAHAAALTAFRLGKTGLLDLLDAQRTWLQLRQQQVQKTLEMQLAATELARLHGLDLALDVSAQPLSTQP